VLDEARAGDPNAARRRLEVLALLPLLAVDARATALAARLLKDCGLPVRAATDALHLAVAAVHEMDYFLTWNCTHLANAEFIPKVRAVCEAAGSSCPAICTPEELMGT
jgi:predicted nucleic acid-binding protein